METLELAPNEKRCSKCKEVKDRQTFKLHKNRYDGLSSYCKRCSNSMEREREARKRLTEEPQLIVCPVCHLSFMDLLKHTLKTHKLGKNDLSDLGVSVSLSPSAIKRRESVGFMNRLGNFATLNSRFITFPKEYWPSICKYTKVEIVRKGDTRLVFFIPYSKKTKFTKSVLFDHGVRNRIVMPKKFLENMKTINRPLLDLPEGIGEQKKVVIRFTKDDDGLLKELEFWAKSGQSIKNTSDLTIKINGRHKEMTIADHILPKNVIYVQLSWNQAKSRRSLDYLDVKPLISEMKLENCRKLQKNSNRLVLNVAKFINKNNISEGNWELENILPDGSLRFTNIEQKTMLPKHIVKTQPLPKPLREPQPMYTPEGTFEDWLTEIGANDDIAS